MPRYKSRRKSARDRDRKRVRARMPRDRRHLMHWAVRGTHDDYAKFRKHAAEHISKAPTYIDNRAVEALPGVDRPKMVQALGKEPYGGGWFSDGLAWLIDKVPDTSSWSWMKKVGQASLKPFRGDSLSDTDQAYARLVDQSYKLYEKKAPDQFEHWKRAKEFDSNYISVWDNEDGHRFIAVRGTKPSSIRDLAEDASIAYQGTTFLDEIGNELRRIVNHTNPDVTVDIGGHSLGTTMILKAYSEDKHLQDRMHETYLYNPAVSPFAEENVTQKFEGDDRVRYFIDLSDPVSIGDLGEKGPKNVVYRNNWNPLTAHSLSQWGGQAGWSWQDAQTHEKVEEQQQKDELPRDTNGDGIPDAIVGVARDVAKDYLMDFGDSFDSKGWDVYFNKGAEQQESGGWDVQFDTRG